MLNVSYVLKHTGEPVAFEQVLAPPEIDGAVFTDVNIAGEVIGLDRDNLSVSGRLSTNATQSCARCGGDAAFSVDCTFEEVFARAQTPERPDSFLFEGSQIDLSEMAECLIVLALPMRVLCREDCMGLCPTCGKNLNEGPCRHQ